MLGSPIPGGWKDKRRYRSDRRPGGGLMKSRRRQSAPKLERFEDRVLLSTIGTRIGTVAQPHAPSTTSVDVSARRRHVMAPHDDHRRLGPAHDRERCSSQNRLDDRSRRRCAPLAPHHTVWTASSVSRGCSPRSPKPARSRRASRGRTPRSASTPRRPLPGDLTATASSTWSISTCSARITAPRSATTVTFGRRLQSQRQNRPDRRPLHPAEHGAAQPQDPASARRALAPGEEIQYDDTNLGRRP